MAKAKPNAIDLWRMIEHAADNLDGINEVGRLLQYADKLAAKGAFEATSSLLGKVGQEYSMEEHQRRITSAESKAAELAGRIVTDAIRSKKKGKVERLARVISKRRPGTQRRKSFVLVGICLDRLIDRESYIKDGRKFSRWPTRKELKAEFESATGKEISDGELSKAIAFFGVPLKDGRRKLKRKRD